MFVKQFHMGGDRNFGYLVADPDSRQAAVIDPSYTPEQIASFAQEQGYEIIYVLNTHGHEDHTNGNETMAELSGVQALGYGDTDPHTEVVIEDDAVLPLGELEIRVIHTPGHAPDAVCYLVNGAVFTGDTLFVGKVGGTDLGEEARAEYHSLHKKLLALPDTTVVYPGHDVGVAPFSTIGDERLTNPFLTQPNYEAFVDLKRNWAAYKEEHGIA